MPVPSEVTSTNCCTPAALAACGSGSGGRRGQKAVVSGSMQLQMRHGTEHRMNPACQLCCTSCTAHLHQAGGALAVDAARSQHIAQLALSGAHSAHHLQDKGVAFGEFPPGSHLSQQVASLLSAAPKAHTTCGRAQAWRSMPSQAAATTNIYDRCPAAAPLVLPLSTALPSKACPSHLGCAANGGGNGLRALQVALNHLQRPAATE